MSGLDRRQDLMLQPVLQGGPEDACAEEAQRQTAERVDPAKHMWVKPAASPAYQGADTDAPEDRAEKEASEEEGKLPAGRARSYYTAPQTRPEGKTHGIGQTKDHAGREITARGGRLASMRARGDAWRLQQGPAMPDGARKSRQRCQARSEKPGSESGASLRLKRGAPTANLRSASWFQRAVLSARPARLLAVMLPCLPRRAQLRKPTAEAIKGSGIIFLSRCPASPKRLSGSGAPFSLDDRRKRDRVL